MSAYTELLAFKEGLLVRTTKSGSSGTKGAIRLSRREAELLTFLLEHPAQRFTPLELADQAWLARNLSVEQVRNYVVRLRRKVSGADLPCTLVSEPGTGYSLKWS